jgi:thiamine-monophosphate kinase
MYSENQIVDKIRKQFADSSAVIGIGDDAAVVDLPDGFSTVVCSDLLAENTHFRRSTHPPDSVGFKAIAVNVSDIGAMGGTPAYCLVSLALPAGLEASWFDGFADGVRKACSAFKVSLIGGDTSEAECIFVDVCVIGQIRPNKAVRRSGARPGDGVYVTGAIGGATLGLRLLEEGRTDGPAVRRHLYPEPRHQIGREIAEQATSMTDISDGFSTDLGHLLSESSVSARIEGSRIPLHTGAELDLALDSGEEYELLITARELPAELHGIPITQVGRIIQSNGVHQAFLEHDSGERILEPGGWKHLED